jgi:hypothetical protein
MSAILAAIPETELLKLAIKRTDALDALKKCREVKEDAEAALEEMEAPLESRICVDNEFVKDNLRSDQWKAEDNLKYALQKRPHQKRKIKELRAELDTMNELISEAENDRMEAEFDLEDAVEELTEARRLYKKRNRAYTTALLSSSPGKDLSSYFL